MNSPIEWDVKGVLWVWPTLAVLFIATLIIGVLFLTPVDAESPLSTKQQLVALSARQSLQEERITALIELTEQLRQDANNNRFDKISQHRRPLIEDMIPAVWSGCGEECHVEH
jgi:hypothetical protein